MKQETKKQLKRLRAQYAKLTGRPFEYFFCPLLFKDEDVELCRGHIINASFPGSEKRSIVQRKDVDSFYGSKFEADFASIQERGKHNPLKVLTDKKLSRRLKPKVTIDGAPVEHYHTAGQVPPQHTAVEFDDGNQLHRFALKLSPAEASKASKGNWQVVIEKDVRLQAFGSILKAAHLTLFEMLGYDYGLSLGGHFLGHTVLGKFFMENRNLPPESVHKNAASHFAEFSNMARPIISAPPVFGGTATDRYLLLCMSGSRPWAYLVLVRTGDLRHAVVAPTFADAENSARYLRFLKEPPPRIEGNRGEVSRESLGILQELDADVQLAYG